MLLPVLERERRNSEKISCGRSSSCSLEEQTNGVVIYIWTSIIGRVEEGVCGWNRLEKLLHWLSCFAGHVDFLSLPSALALSRSLFQRTGSEDDILIPSGKLAKVFLPNGSFPALCYETRTYTKSKSNRRFIALWRWVGSIGERLSFPSQLWISVF